MDVLKTHKKNRIDQLNALLKSTGKDSNIDELVNFKIDLNQVPDIYQTSKQKETFIKKKIDNIFHGLYLKLSSEPYVDFTTIVPADSRYSSSDSRYPSSDSRYPSSDSRYSSSDSRYPSSDSRYPSSDSRYPSSDSRYSSSDSRYPSSDSRYPSSDSRYSSSDSRYSSSDSRYSSSDSRYSSSDSRYPSSDSRYPSSRATVPVFPVPGQSRSEYNVVIESNDSNYGHSLFWQFKEAIPYNLNSNSKTREIVRLVNRNKIRRVDNDFLILKRYSINTFKPPSNSRDPTLCMSLFCKNNEGISERWMSRYCIPQIIIGLVFKHWFPNGNYRNYMDKFMMDKFKQISGNNSILFMSSYTFLYHDYEKEYETIVRDKINNFFNEMKEMDNYPFANGLERIMYYFTKATQGDFYIYQLTHPDFIEPNGHKTNGYIGQHMRYISQAQKRYKYNGRFIDKPRHCVWRDAHANMPGYNDSLWIREMNKVNKEVYLLPNSANYIASWHDDIKVDGVGTMKRSAIAGVVQMVNTTIADNDLLYYTTIGLCFGITHNNKSYISNNRNMITPKHPELTYGIDEFVLTSLFYSPYILSRSIYFNNRGWWEFINYKLTRREPDINIVALCFMLKYLQNTGVIGQEYLTRSQIIKHMENIRNSTDINHVVGFVLSMIPTKYHLHNAIFSVIGTPPRDF
jgi:hypothetical protein